ncbi:MAG TPA: HAD-IIA family hydrolase [Thermomicrobiales bacterium]|jgi:4-nitrophenyl phosphatase|nr:HAD-IIA family hydrolase [Thermomicrobiales bacterium]
MTTVPAPASADLDRLRTAKAFIFDMDGVLYRGSDPLPGVGELLAAIESRGAGFVLATNNSMASPQQYAERLSAMGLTVGAEKIQTSGTATRDYLKQHLPEGAPVYVVGMPGLKEQIYDVGGFTVAEPAEGVANTAAVVCGLDQTFTYDKLKAAFFAIRAGARFIATNIDSSLPTESGFVPGAGTIIAAIRTATGVEPTVIGKPSPEVLIQAALELGAGPAESVMIGDRLDTDILAGNRAKMLTAMVLTGVSTFEEVAGSGITPDIVIPGLPELRALLEG